MHGNRNVQLVGSLAVANRLAEAVLCLESRPSTRTRVYHPNMPDLAIPFCAHSRPMTPIRDQCHWQLEVGSARVSSARHEPRSHHIAGLLEVECEGQERSAQLQGPMDVPNAYRPRNTQRVSARSARDECSVVAFPSERRLSPRSDRSLEASPADRRDWLAARLRYGASTSNIRANSPRFTWAR